MGLTNTNTNTTEKPSFEDEAGATATKGAADVKVETTATEAPKTGTAVVAAPTKTAVAVRGITVNPLDEYKDAMRVEYNTLAQLTAQQGNMMDRETKKVLGDMVVFQLLSWQDSFVVSPEDDDAPDDVVRYSDDGIVCTDAEGTSVADALAEMRKGWPKARLKQRAVVVGAVESAVKSPDFNGKLVQLDLSPASRTQWKRYIAETAYAASVGKRTVDEVTRVKVTTRIAQGAGNNSYTLAEFAVAD